MKFFKNLLLLLSIFTLFGCPLKNKPNEDGLDKYRNRGQLIDLSYDEFDQMLIDDEDFVFFLKRNGCSSCAQFYPEVEEFLDENKDLKLYNLNLSNLGATQSLTVSSYFIDALGTDYYLRNEYDPMTLYTPTIGKIVDGEFVYVNIGILNSTELLNFYQDNYYHLETYYSYNKKVQAKDTFDLFVSNEYDAEYDVFLRSYFKENVENEGFYLDCLSFDESEQNKLLNRLNYYLGEDNRVEQLPSYYYLRYENGVITNYQEVKMDITLLDELYKTN